MLVAAELTWTATGALAGTATAAPTGCDPADAVGGYGTEDVDNDTFSDVVVGVPQAPADGRTGAGAVDVHHPGTSVAAQRFGESYLGQTPTAGDGFGSAVAFTRVDNPQGWLREGCADLVIGAPGAAGGRGRVTVALASRSGILPDPAVTLIGRNPGDHFGASISVYDRDVWVGAPDQSVRGRAGAGAVYHYRITGNGTLTFVGALSENSPLVPGEAEVGDHFGQVLSASEGRLVVGEPGEDAGGVRDAGAVTLLVTTVEHGDVASGAKVSENSRGVPAVAAAGDRFGASVSGGASLAVGVPGAEVRGRRDAGAVQLFDTPDGDTARLRVRSRVTQESPTIPGSSEAGDQFGAAVLAGNSDCVWIGVPGEGLGGAAATGEVIRTHVSGSTTTLRLRAFGTVIRLGGRGSDNIPGAPQPGSHVGTSLTAQTGHNASEGVSGGETVTVAVPGYNGTSTGSGEVWISRTTPSVGTQEPPTVIQAGGTYTDSAGQRAHEHYGMLARASSNGSAHGD